MKVDLHATCTTTSCDVTAIDRASLFLSDWQLSLDQTPDAPLNIYTCEGSADVPSIGRRRDVLHLTDGTTREGLNAVGTFFPVLHLGAQFGTGELFSLNSDATIAAVVGEATVTQREENSITFVYPVEELIGVDTGLPFKTPGLRIEERHEFSLVTERVEHLHDALCAPSPPTGFY